MLQGKWRRRLIQENQYCLEGSAQAVALVPNINPNAFGIAVNGTKLWELSLQLIPCVASPTLSCIALCLYIFLQLSLQASGLQQNSFCGSSSHRNCCQAPVALRGQPAQETGKWRVGCEPCLLPFTAWPQPVASTFLGSEQMEEQPNLSLLSSPLPNRVQAMEATGREQSCQITGLGKPNAIFLFPVLPEHQSTLGMVLLSHLATALGWLCDQGGQV